MYSPFTINNIQEVTRQNDGSFFYQLFSSESNSGKTLSDSDKLNLVLTNPAALRVFKLNCDLFSLAKFKAYKNDKLIDNDPLVKLLNNPNPFQSQRQMLWDYMFWNMLGTAYAYPTSKIVKDDTNIYFLNPSRFNWTQELCKKLDKIILSKKSFNDLQGLNIKYRNNDGTDSTYKLSDVIPFFDLSNGLGNWYKGNSSLDALYGIIKNSASTIKAKEITTEFMGKFLVSGQQKPTDMGASGIPMGNAEKESIESSVRGNKSVHAVKNMIEIKRFVDDANKLKLDDSYADDLFKIGSLYNTPKSILDALLKSNSYEYSAHDQFRMVEQCLQPKGNDLADGLERYFGYTDKGIDLRISFSHLSFMKVIEETTGVIISTKLDNIKKAFDMGGLSEDEAKKLTKEAMSYE
jgi:hypothetical protein